MEKGWIQNSQQNILLFLYYQLQFRILIDLALQGPNPTTRTDKLYFFHTFKWLYTHLGTVTYRNCQLFSSDETTGDWNTCHQEATWKSSEKDTKKII